MAAALSAAQRELIDRPVLAAFTTLHADGSPHTTPVWIDRDGDDLLVNTATGRTKPRNVARDPRVSVCVIDPDDHANVVAVEGTVVAVMTAGAVEHINKMAQKYTGAESFGGHAAGRDRLLMRIRCDRVLGIVG
jgi:PPOX class probable F420-dependent enzyme